MGPTKHRPKSVITFLDHTNKDPKGSNSTASDMESSESLPNSESSGSKSQLTESDISSNHEVTAVSTSFPPVHDADSSGYGLGPFIGRNFS